MTTPDIAPPPAVDPIHPLFATLPRRVSIGTNTFRIYVVPADHPKLEESNGMTYTGVNHIYVSGRQEPDSAVRMLDTVLHELAHAITHTRGVEDGSEEETFVTQHTTGLVELLMRNPRVHTWINRAMKLIRAETR